MKKPYTCDKTVTHQSDIKFGKIGRDASVQQAGGDIAGRDVISGDKIGRDQVSAAQKFQNEQDKQEFIAQLEQLRGALREIKTEVEQARELSEDDKDALAMEIMQRIQDLKAAGEEAQTVPAGEQTPPETRKSLMEYLQAAGSLVEKTQKMSEKAAELTLKLAPAVSRAMPLLIKARQLFGL
ncbi:MAG: hypothetical protein GY862_12350 [Gammaproteobacteria bacterium]|nr:hypothetical protein [Gammaproteobacteria bacterium]